MAKPSRSSARAKTTSNTRVAKKPAKKASKKASKKVARKAAKKPASKAAPPATENAGDAAVLKATGLPWEEWIARLDQEGASKMEHKAIAILLHEKFGVGEWWSQMITVGYEQARGLRAKHEKPDGFSVSASRTIEAPVKRAFEAFADASVRGRWLPQAPIEVRKATAPKSLRITWLAGGKDGKSSVEVNLYAKGPGKCQVSIQHNKLRDAAEADEFKTLWRTRVEALKQLLEGA